MKKIILFILISSLTNKGLAQFNEFQYFTMRAGMIHNIGLEMPKVYNDRYLATPSGYLRLENVQVTTYTMGAHAGLFFHYDFTDKQGVMFGGEINNYGVKYQYVTSIKNYGLIETHNLYTIGIPVFLKLGMEMYDNQAYFFIGAQYNLNLKLKETQNIDWETTASNSYFLAENQISTENFMLILGFNFFVFNFELDFSPQNFFNTEYAYEISPDNMTYPYASQPKNLIFFKTSFSIPLNDWAETKNYKFKKFMRKVKFWR